MAKIVENAILIYTDGSLQWKGRKGGYGFAFVYVDPVGEAKVIEEHSLKRLGFPDQSDG